MALAAPRGMGVRLMEGLPTLYSAASGDPKTTLFRDEEPGTRLRRDDEFKMLRGMDIVAVGAGDGATLGISPVTVSLVEPPPPSKFCKSAVLAVEELCTDSESL
jgi:hypothetical protein